MSAEQASPPLRARLLDLPIVRSLPRGYELPEETWASRHRAVVALLWLHAVGLVVFAMATGLGAEHAMGEGGVVAILALVASISSLGRRWRATAASLGLVTSSAVLVHLSGGYTEAHFHFFVMLGVLALYQDWVPYLLAIGFVIVHHAVLGLVDSSAVFNHPAAQKDPVIWALIHGGFILAASALNLVTWRFIEYQSLHDPLTDLPNRRLFGDRVTRALARVGHDRGTVALLFIDLDQFKVVNDRFGHAAGDTVLRATAKRIRDCLRSGDNAGRLGGDEFAVLLEGVKADSEVDAVVERLKAAFAVPIDLGGEIVVVTASVGVSISRPGEQTAETALRDADRAMYAAKFGQPPETGGAARPRRADGARSTDAPGLAPTPTLGTQG